MSLEFLERSLSDRAGMFTKKANDLPPSRADADFELENLTREGFAYKWLTEDLNELLETAPEFKDNKHYHSTRDSIEQMAELATGQYEGTALYDREALIAAAHDVQAQMEPLIADVNTKIEEMERAEELGRQAANSPEKVVKNSFHMQANNGRSMSFDKDEECFVIQEGSQRQSFRVSDEKELEAAIASVQGWLATAPDNSTGGTVMSMLQNIPEDKRLEALQNYTNWLIENPQANPSEYLAQHSGEPVVEMPDVPLDSASCATRFERK